MTINIDANVCGLLMFSVVNTPIEGLRWSDFGKLEELKKLFRWQQGDGPREVEVPSPLTGLLKAAWKGAEAGNIPRFDGMAKAVEYLEGVLKE